MRAIGFRTSFNAIVARKTSQNTIRAHPDVDPRVAHRVSRNGSCQARRLRMSAHVQSFVSWRTVLARKPEFRSFAFDFVVIRQVKRSPFSNNRSDWPEYHPANKDNPRPTQGDFHRTANDDSVRTAFRIWSELHTGTFSLCEGRSYVRFEPCLGCCVGRKTLRQARTPQVPYECVPCRSGALELVCGKTG